MAGETDDSRRKPGTSGVCRRWRRCTVCASLILLLTARGADSTSIQESTDRGIQPVRAEDQHGSVVGIIYPVEVLSLLVREKSMLRPRLELAIRDQTPIVVMWAIPGHQHTGATSERYEVAVVERGQQVIGNPHRIDPVWNEQDAGELLRLSKIDDAPEVATMAAFPAKAFVAGRQLIVYCQEPARPDGTIRTHERGGWIRWSGAQAVARH